MLPKTTYNDESLKRHKVSHSEVNEALFSAVWEEIPPSDRGNNRLMFVGFTGEGRLLEVGVEYFDDQDREHIFHAREATKASQELFMRRTTT